MLRLELWVQENGGEGMPYVLRFYDPETETWLSTSDEERAARQAAEEALQAAEARAAEEAEARRQAEAELARMQAELARLRGESQEEGEDES